MKIRIILFIIGGVLVLSSACQKQPTWKSSHNSLGMEMIKIEPGTFVMGDQNDQGSWDEKPAHMVAITQPFHISQTEITITQYQQFRPDYKVAIEPSPYARGLSWYDARAFCQWLSDKEGKVYRLPTEAEWEYVCRAGTTTPFSSGDHPPDPEMHNPWGVRNMHTGVLEWCFDWYGSYPHADQVDPVGPRKGMARILRGGLPDILVKAYDHPPEYYARSANRAAIAPAFSRFISTGLEKGNKTAVKFPVGFRVVQVSMPETSPLNPTVPFAQQGIKQQAPKVNQGPDPNNPFFRKRYLLPVPLDNSDRKSIDAAGLHSSFRGHNHSPALEVCSNGDVLLVIYTSYHEYEPGVSLIAARLRFGSDQWDMPSPFIDFVDINDHAPLLWNDKGKLNLFWGNPRINSAFPFQWTSSTDNGASFEEVRFPVFKGNVGSHSRQPINTAFRDNKGTIYVSSDGDGGRSVLWRSSDNGKTWVDPGGRSGGRHTTFVPLNNGSILGMGGKNTSVDGYMPQSVSRDGGESWVVSKTVFPALASNQRPTIIRLNSSRLFFAGDFQKRGGEQPANIKEKGAFVALSDDEGETWRLKKLPGTQLHESDEPWGNTLGYSVARQAPNGIIHLITTMNHPCLHFVLNEAWILDTEKTELSEEILMKSSAQNIRNVNTYTEKYPNGKIRIEYTGGIADNGRFLLHGKEIWYYENGQKQWEAIFDLGKKSGEESHWTPDGILDWQWIHEKDDVSQWTQWWENGEKKAQSTWRNMCCNGVARCWDDKGNLISEVNFINGIIAE